MSAFNVPKGSDIRLVLNGTSCGLNNVLWAPWFALPSVDTMLGTMDVGYWSTNNDIGKMFYNFWLHELLHNLCGIDLSKLLVDKMIPTQHVLWEW